MHRLALAASASLALLAGLVGCHSDGMAGAMDKSSMMTVMDSSTADAMKAAPMDGVYYLYASEGGARPMLQARLKKGDMLGFKTMSDGKVMAMAGEKKMDVTGMKTMWVHGMAK